MNKDQLDTQKYFYRILMVLLGLSCHGCSNRQIYDSLQTYQRSKCNESARIEYDDCMERTEKPYYIYKKEYEDYSSEYRKDSDILK